MRKGIIRRYASVAFGIASILAIAGCGGSAATGASGTSGKRVLRIGFASDLLSQPAQAEAALGAEAEAKRLGVQLFQNHAADAAGQANGITDLFSENINALAIDPNDGKAIGTSVKEANARHIPVVMFIGTDQGGGKTATLVTTNEVQGGYAISKAMFQALGGHGQVAFIQGCICHPAGAAREKGFREALKQYPGIKLVAYGATGPGWDPTVANRIVTDQLSKNPNINGFITLTDAFADAARQAILATGGRNHALVSGYNGACPIVSEIWKGQIAMTLDQDWRNIGKVVVDEAVAAARGQHLPSLVTLPSYVIDKQAIQEIQAGTFPGETPILKTQVEAAVHGCPGV
jgi:ABC-type sugar transport system substrate-binding protein